MNTKQNGVIMGTLFDAVELENFLLGPTESKVQYTLDETELNEGNGAAQGIVNALLKYAPDQNKTIGAMLKYAANSNPDHDIFDDALRFYAAGGGEQAQPEPEPEMEPEVEPEVEAEPEMEMEPDGADDAAAELSAEEEFDI